MLGLSVSGISPGFDYSGVHIPLNYDSVLATTLALGNSSMTINFQGTFDADGRSVALLCIPSGLSATTVYAAFAMFNSSVQIVGSSNPVQFVLQ